MLQERPVGGSGAREGSGSGSGAEQLEERMRELISAEVTRSILDQTPVIFGMVKEGIVDKNAYSQVYEVVQVI